MAVLSDFLTKINAAKRIALFSHTNPDGDAISSCLALKDFIRTNFKRKKVDIFIDTGEKLSSLYLPLINKEKLNKQHVKKYNLAIALDCTDGKRFEKYLPIFNATPVKINIDHHDTNTNFGGLNIVAESASSTCEIIYSLALKSKKTITPELAKLVYVGILTDTVCLTQNNVTRNTYRVLSDISKFNIDLDKIKTYFFKTNSKAKTFLLEKALRSLKFYDDDQIAIMKIKNNDLTTLNATAEDTLGIVEHANNIEGVLIAALILEKELGKYYVSLRSKGFVNTAEIAKHFGGGGHENMSAFQIDRELTKLTTELVEKCKETIKNNIPSEKIQDYSFI